MAGYGERASDGKDRIAKMRSRLRAIPRRQCDDPKRRIRLEKDTPKWLRFYMGERTFPAPFADSHMEIIHNAEYAASTGTGTASAAPRGDGKTTIYRGVSINLLARRIIRFPVLAGWIKGQADEAFARWLQMLSESPEFAADYPEITQPFEVSTHNLALRGLTWQDTGDKIGAAVRTVHKVIVLPDSIGAIAARSVQGDAKGLNVTLPDGTILRPDFLLLDDAQDASQAGNPVAVAKTVDVIENIFMGLAGPQKRLTTAAACTVEREGDVSCHFLTRPGWKTVRVSRVVSWPGGSSGGTWKADADDPQLALWKEWHAIGLEQGQKEARAFYKANKQAMIAGMSVSWEHRFDPKRNADCYDAAMWEWFDKGEDVFARGQQNLPLAQGASIYSLTPDLIAGRVDKDYPAGRVPEWAHTIIAATDINYSYGLTTAVVAFGADQRAHVVWYGVYRDPPLPCSMDDAPAVISRAVKEALAAHGQWLGEQPFRPAMWIVDGGGTPLNTVIDFAAVSLKACDLQAVAAFGRNCAKYRQAGRSGQHIKTGENCHMLTESMTRRWMIWNADVCREMAQKGWTSAPALPGSCSLFPGQHYDFAAQIASEQLKWKQDTPTGLRYEWHTIPGRHDYGDCMSMAFAAADFGGIRTGGKVQQKQQQRKRRPSGVTVIEL